MSDGQAPQTEPATSVPTAPIVTVDPVSSTQDAGQQQSANIRRSPSGRFEKGGKPVNGFKPGQSGNPAGRKPDVWDKDRLKRALQHLGPEAADMVWKALEFGLDEGADEKAVAIGLKAAMAVAELGMDLGGQKAPAGVSVNVNVNGARTVSLDDATETGWEDFAAARTVDLRRKAGVAIPASCVPVNWERWSLEEQAEYVAFAARLQGFGQGRKALDTSAAVDVQVTPSE